MKNIKYISIRFDWYIKVQQNLCKKLRFYNSQLFKWNYNSSMWQLSDLLDNTSLGLVPENSFSLP